MKRFVFVVAAFLFAVTAFAQIDPNAPLQRDPAFLYGKLDNGLTYYIRHNEKPEKRAEFYLLTDVGAIQETPAQAGLAHFLEHMCLNGTKNFPGKGIIEYFESIGAKFGANINASTGVEQTMYMLNNIPVTRQGIIDSALLVLHDYSGFVTNDPAEIDAERGVIIEEWRTRSNNQWRAMEKAWQVLFQGSKFATCNVIGTVENLQSFPPEELVSFYKDWYHPGNQAVVIVGDIDPEYVLAKLTELYADIPLKTDAKVKDVITVPENAEPLVGIITDPEANGTSIEAVLKSTPLPKELRGVGMGYLTDLIETILNGMFSERLSDAAKKPGAPFYEAGASFVQLRSNIEGLDMGLGCKDGEGIEAFTGLMTEIEKIKRYGFTSSEFERVKTNLINNAENATSNASSRKNDEFVYLCQNDFFNGVPAMDPAYEEQQLKGYLSILTVDMINQTVAQLLDFSKNLVILYNAPEKEGITHPTEEELAAVIKNVEAAEIENDVKNEELGELLDPASIKAGKVKKVSEGIFGTTVWKLSNGIRVTMRPSDYNKEQILVNFRILGGSSLIEDEEMPSIDENMFSFYNLYGGLSKFTASDLEKMMTGKIINWNLYYSTIANGINGSCAPKDFETLLQAIHLQLTDPRFVEDDMAPAMAQMGAIVPNLEKQPNYIVSKAYYNALYGENNPRHELISSEKMAKIDFKSLEKSIRTMYSNAQGAELVITGNFDPESIKPLVEKYIGSVPTARKAQRFIDRDEDQIVPGSRECVVETKMEVPKTTCILNISGDCDGGLESRLLMQAVQNILDIVYTKTIREEEGGTYGVGIDGNVSLLPRAKATMTIQFDTDPQRAEQLMELAWKGIQDIAQNGPEQEHLDKFKENRLKNLSESRENNQYWTNIIIGYYNTGIDQDTDFTKTLEGITIEKVRDFLADLIAQDNVVKLMMNPSK